MQQTAREQSGLHDNSQAVSGEKPLLTALSPYALNVCLIYVPHMYPLHDMYGLQETDTYGGG